MSSETDDPDAVPAKQPAASPSEGVVRRCDVLVLGASFAGIEVLLQLQRRLRRPLEMVVVDRQSRHGYIPLVHERLCGRIAEPDATLDTAAFVRSLPGVRFLEDEVIAFDPADKRVTLGSGQQVRARFVVVALGSVLEAPDSLPGVEHLLGYKRTSRYRGARAQLERCLAGEAQGDAPRLVVVGGGISGVELAGELAHLRVKRPPGWRPPAVTLVAARARLLSELGRGVGDKAASSLRAQGVDVRLETRVVEVGPRAVGLERGGETLDLPCAATLWAGGVRPGPVLAALGLPRTEQGWIAVGPTLQCFPCGAPDSPDVFACGDAVRVMSGAGQWPTMQRAIECLWQAKVVARNIATLARHPPDYPEGVPPMRPHRLRERFAYGVSLGARSLVVYGPARVDVPVINPWFRRWLMRQYFARYAPRAD